MSRVANTSGSVSASGASHASDATVPTAVSFHMELESVEDFSDLYQCGLGQEQLDGRMQPFADHFDIDACCDECEKQIISLVRKHLHEYQKALGVDDSDNSDDSVDNSQPSTSKPVGSSAPAESHQCPRDLEMKCLRALALLASEDPSDSAESVDSQ